MINDTVIFDDFISKNYQNELEKTCLSEKIPYYYLEDLTGSSSTIKNKGFVHNLFRFEYNDNDILVSPYHHLVFPLLLEAASKINLQEIKIYKGRIFLQTAKNLNTINNPHTDLVGKDHLVFLYYVNNSDGDTVIYNETINNIPFLDMPTLDMLTIKEKINPKKGRIVIFNGKHYHSSSSPSIKTRCTINYNIYI